MEILDKLEAIKKRWEDLANQMNDPSAMSDMKRFVQLNKNYKELDPIVKAYDEYSNLLANIISAKDILKNEKDPDFKEMAKEELDELEPKKEELIWDDLWAKAMLNYAINEAGERIVLITTSNKKRFQKELTKILTRQTEEGLGLEETTRLIEKNLVKEVVNYQRYMSRRIAQTEILSASNIGQREAIDNLTIPVKKVWMCGGARL